MVETLSAPFYYIRNFFSHLAEFFSELEVEWKICSGFVQELPEVV